MGSGRSGRHRSSQDQSRPRCDGSIRVVAPRRPGPWVERRGDAQGRQRQHCLCGGNPRAAVCRHPPPVGRCSESGGETVAQDELVRERPVGREQPGHGDVDRARNVPGHRVDRFGLAAEALGGSHIDEDALVRRGRSFVRGESRQMARMQARESTICHLSRHGRVSLRHHREPGHQPVSRRSPGGDPTVEHPHRQSHPPQNPPGPAGREGPGLVLDHGQPIRAGSSRPEGGPQGLEIGQRVASVPWISGMPRQRRFEVKEGRGGDVARGIPVPSGTRRIGERPADVEQSRWFVAGECVNEIGDGDQDLGTRQGGSLEPAVAHNGCVGRARGRVVSCPGPSVGS